MTFFSAADPTEATVGQLKHNRNLILRSQYLLLGLFIGHCTSVVSGQAQGSIGMTLKAFKNHSETVLYYIQTTCS